MIYCLYKITNKVNGHFYLGAHKTVNLYVKLKTLMAFQKFARVLAVLQTEFDRAILVFSV